MIPGAIISTDLRRAACTACGCILARDNSNDMCSPCTTATGRRRWMSEPATASRSSSAAGFPGDDVAVISAPYSLGAEQAVDSLFASGTLPGRLWRYRHLLVRLVELRDLNHSAAARELGVTRWTVASWRERMRLDSALISDKEHSA